MMRPSRATLRTLQGVSTWQSGFRRRSRRRRIWRPSPAGLASMGTFGEDAQLAKSQVEAYVAGFQDGESGLHAGSVMCVVKHWVGYGAMKEGLDGA